MTTPKPKSHAHAPPSVHKRTDDAHAFLPDPDDGPVHVRDDLAEELGEEFISGATSGEGAAEESLNDRVSEEVGGPFITTTGKEEYARGRDGSNPRGADKEAFPSPMRGTKDDAEED